MFHLIVILAILILSIRYGKWNRWEAILPTIYYFCFFNMFYQYIAFSLDMVWMLKRTFISMFITDVLYTFIAYPCLVLIFLTNYPENKRLKILHYGKYIAVSVILESFARKLGYIDYYNGWNIWWTAFFYVTMYPMVRLHHIKPLKAIPLSMMIVVFYLIIFDIPVLK